jgi:hypothetical protein
MNSFSGPITQVNLWTGKMDGLDMKDFKRFYKWFMGGLEWDDNAPVEKAWIITMTFLMVVLMAMGVWIAWFLLGLAT